MPDAKPWEAFAPKPEKGPWDEYAKPQGRSKSLAESVRESGPAGELVGQLGRFVKGAGETAKTALALTPPGMAIRGPKATQETIKGLGEIVKAPVRELGGLPQPGETSYQALPFAERPLAAIGTLLGADPARVRALEAQGETGKAWAARLTVPALTLGLGELLRVGAGKRLPPTETRVGKLSAATGATPGVNLPEAYQRVLPRLDKAVQASGKIPLSPQDLLATVGRALTSAENEFNLALKPIASNRVVATPVADAIRAKVSPAMSQTAEGQAMAKALQARAVEFDKPWTFQQLNDERMRLFRMAKAPAMERAAMRSNADLLADKAAENALREMVYGEVERTQGRPGYFRALKSDESAMIDLKDTLEKRVVQLSNEEAIAKGTPWLAHENISIYGHPEAGRIGTSVHQLQRVVTGAPKGMKAAKKAVRGSFEPVPRVTRPRQVGAAALFGRVPSQSAPLKPKPPAETPSQDGAPESSPSVTPDNNNPGNIKTPSGTLKRYSTAEEGWRDLHDYLQRAATGVHESYRPEMSLREFFRVYAPASDRNDPEAYATRVAKRLGVPPETPISRLVDRIPKWAAEINKVEWGSKASEAPQGLD